MSFPLPLILREELAGTGDGEESVVLLHPSANVPQFVLSGYRVEDHGELGNLGGGGGGARASPFLSPSRYL